VIFPGIDKASYENEIENYSDHHSGEVEVLFVEEITFIAFRSTKRFEKYQYSGTKGIK